MPLSVPEAFELLFNKNNNIAYKALCELTEESDKTDSLYPYMDRMGAMLLSDNSYIRARGLTLIAHNVKWDKENKIYGLLPEFLKHLADEKPIVTRQCIKLLPIIAKDKPRLRETILSALRKANISFYESSMQLLIYKDMKKAIEEIKAL